MVAGNLMNETKVGDKIFDFAHKLVCHLPGGLAQVNIVTSMVMAGMSGHRRQRTLLRRPH